MSQPRGSPTAKLLQNRERWRPDANVNLRTTTNIESMVRRFESGIRSLSLAVLHTLQEIFMKIQQGPPAVRWRFVPVYSFL